MTNQLPSTQQYILDKLADGKTKPASGEAVTHLVNRGLIEKDGDGYRATSAGLAAASS